jgi:HK97 family phage prohead protease
MRTDRQIRYADTAFEIRTADGGGNTLVGHAAVFNVETVIAGMFREEIAPRAFRKSMKENDIRALFNHDTNVVLGRNKAGTLRLSEDDTGLAYEIDLPDTQAARDLWTSIDRGDISQSSFAFDPVKELRTEADADAGETMPLFTVKEARLFDVSPVTFPAYETTDVSARVLLRVADLSGRTIDEVTAAYESGDSAGLWTPRDATTGEPSDEPQDGPALDAGTPQPEQKRNPYLPLIGVQR